MGRGNHADALSHEAPCHAIRVVGNGFDHAMWPLVGSPTMRSVTASTVNPMISIAASTPKIDVDNRFPLFKYYRAADNLLKQANIYREEKNIVDLYILLLRFCSLVGETIPEHRDYRTSSTKLKNEYIKRLGQALSELEKLKPEAQKELARLNSLVVGVSGQETDAMKQYEWPLGSKFQGSTHFNGQIGQPSGMMQAYSRKPYPLEDHLKNLSFSLPPPKLETLSRHSFLSQSGIRAPVGTHYSLAKVQYPTYVDVSSSESPSLTQISTEAVPVIKDSSLSASLDLDVLERHKDSRESDYASQLRLISQPFPPPVAALVQNLPSTSSICVDPIPPSRVADPFPGPVSSIAKVNQRGEGPKQLYISAKMMDEFLRLAMENTNKNVETCGVLAGCLKNAAFYVTALIIPKQEATSDSCQTVNEEEIFTWQDERNLFQLGWIHTHPKQSCFMSSIDLHTHYSYQVMLPEAIAIVMAPTDSTRTSGIFRLSDPQGIKLIQNCQMRGFHPHEQPSDGSSIYEHCGHVLMSSRLAYQVVDLR
ncbi:hypothetical protein GOP47_0007479 [Adiantum capillus-veneris]|uniref:MPN domain-containing protein n=1 Tax=Adiantum capillus-veneris TaxID=13818 RepID=A0A9D4V0T0_ADICA|nr:hypothetical protein GOP47_0007479 [Adiantum capillus-veneris]